MRILMLSWEYPPHVVGGIGTHVAALIPMLARRGVQVTLVTPRWSGGDPVSRIGDNAVIYRVDPPNSRRVNFYADAQETNRSLVEMAERAWQSNGGGDSLRGFDLIHAHDWLVAFAADSLKQLHKTPLVSTIHATERGRGRGNLVSDMSNAINGTEWWLAYESWRLITVSRHMADEIKGYFQVPPDKVDVIPNGVETAQFDALRNQDLRGFRTGWAEPEDSLVFYVGRMQYEKGAQVLIEAAPRVLSEFGKTRFVLAGSGPMVDMLRRRVHELNLADRVTVTGFIPDEDRNKLLQVASLAVFPSLYEPFGIVALEAMAAGCPVVASNVGGLSEVVRNDETGVLVQPDNAESLALGIRQVLAHPAEAKQWAANARRMVESEYSWDRIAERTIEVYDRVVGERRAAVWA